MFQISAVARDAVPLNQGRIRWVTHTKIAHGGSALKAQNFQSQKQRTRTINSNQTSRKISYPRNHSEYHVFNLAHVPMSLWARTSVLDLWSGSKYIKKEWIWVNGWCWLGLLDGELHWLWFTGCSCSPFQCCNLRWSSVFGDVWYPLCAVWFYLCHLHWFSGTRPGGHWAFAVNCHEHAAHLRCRQEVCRVGWGAVSRRDDLTQSTLQILQRLHDWRQPIILDLLHLHLMRVWCRVPRSKADWYMHQTPH